MMAKGQKLKPKFIKKDITENVKKNLFKKNNVDCLKKKGKKSGETLKTAAKIEVSKDVKQKGSDLTKKSKVLPETRKEIVPKKKPQLVETPKKSIANKNDPESKSKLIKKKKFVGGKVEKKTLLAAKSEKRKEHGGKLDDKIKNELGPKLKEKIKKEDLKAGTGRATTSVFEPVDFDEVHFNDIVCLENIEKISNALKVLVEKQVSEKKTAIFTDYRYFLNVASYKIPNCPKRMVKLNLKHSLVDIKEDDVVVIVADLQRGSKVDYEPTIQHYEDLLREIGMDNIKIVPFNQLRQECTSYEAKRKFASTYDYFLCDGRIVGHVSAFCGRAFQNSRTTIHAVRMDNNNNNNNNKRSIEHALKRTSYKQLKKGDLISIPVGNHRFTVKQLSENIKEVIKQLKTLFPGGYANIRSLYVKIDIQGTSSLPLYANFSGAPAEIPNIIGPLEQKMIKLKKEANNILSKFNISKTGEFIKLNKTEIKRKQKMRVARKALLSKENAESDENNSEGSLSSKPKKVENGKQIASPSQMDDGESDDGGDNTNQAESEISDEE